jgi:hypothetical protein
MYDGGLNARARAWHGAQSKLAKVATREQAALVKVNAGGLAAVDASKVRATEARTLSAIDGPIGASQAYTKNRHFRGKGDAPRNRAAMIKDPESRWRSACARRESPAAIRP